MSSFRLYKSHDNELYAHTRQNAPRQSQSQYTLSDRSLGGKTIGKAKIDVCLRRQMTRWGVRNGHSRRDQQHCGLLVIQLSSVQDPSYKLRSMSGVVEFEGDITLGEVKPPTMSGAPSEKRMTTSAEVAPNVQAPGTTISGLNFSRSTESTRVDRWSFSAKKTTDAHGQYRQLCWTLEDHKDGSGSIFDRPINLYVEMFFETRSPKPVKVTVDVEGKLRSRRAEMKRKWFTFAPEVACKGRPIEPRFPKRPQQLDTLRSIVMAEVWQANQDAIPEIVDLLPMPA
ncbi:hypothetical protein CAC42_5984 [Sphaceloma murrayae]|uniref:Uncharacterized protein n=1 Tax=Sphaceloma murrayae TaxID=2082308 RepID=A0A2K1QZQ7_9PEZI|nr:hypothetical protein CAC42_5984 [Sphaceloma murrayae]